MAKAGQTLHDRFNAARYALAGQGLARVVCKATTEEVNGPKKKHLDYLLQCTEEANVSIPQLANLLIERTTHNSWVVVFKALITVHHLMCYGNERFTQYLASSNCTFQLSNFVDKNGLKGMDIFIKRYSKYINEKAISYRLVAFDFAKIKRGKEDGLLRSMPCEKLLKNLAILQNQIDALLEFDCSPTSLCNGVINAAFVLLFRDCIRLFACYNDGIINLLERYFDMNKKQCKEALDIYKRFLIRMDRVSEFLKVAENVGIDKGKIPDLTRAPSSLLEALEQHLQVLEGKKGKSKDNVQSVVSSNGTSNSHTLNEPINGVKDDAVKKALEEEAALMNQLKPCLMGTDMSLSSRSSSFIWKQEPWAQLEKHVEDSKKPYNPFLSSPDSSSKDILDLFNTNAVSNANVKGVKHDDLLMLSSNSASLDTAAKPAANPFADMLPGVSNTNTNSVNSYGLMGLGTTMNPMAPVNPIGNLNMNNPMMSIGTINPATGATLSSNITSSVAVDSLRNNPMMISSSNPMISNVNATGGFDANFAAVFGPSTDSNTSTGDCPPERPAQPKAVPPPLQDEDEEVCEHMSKEIPKLAVPGCGSSSPSPTNELMRGDGTTPILPTPPEEEATSSHSPFGTPLYPKEEKSDLFGFDDTSKEEIGSGATAPPPSPFPFDFMTTNTTLTEALSTSAQPKDAFEDLDLAVRSSFGNKSELLPSPIMPVGLVYVPASSGVNVGMTGSGPVGISNTKGIGIPSVPLQGIGMGVGKGQGFDALGDILQPQKSSNPLPQNMGMKDTSSTGSLIKGDLDSSLASLAQNLDINGPKRTFKKPGQQQFVNSKNSNWSSGTPIGMSGQMNNWTSGGFVNK